MESDQSGYIPQPYDVSSLKIRDLEEKQRILKDRLLLIGQNLIDSKEETSQKILELKKEVELLRQSIERITSFLEAIPEELSKLAKQEDLNVLAKQAKMFQPMDFLTRKDLEKLKRG